MKIRICTNENSGCTIKLRDKVTKNSSFEPEMNLSHKISKNLDKANGFLKYA